MDPETHIGLGSNLHQILSIRCSVKKPLFCQECESCKLIEKINRSKAWFIPLSHNNKKCFLQQLILSAADNVARKIPNMLNSLQGKDYQYAKTRLRPSIYHDSIQDHSDHSIDLTQIEDMVNNEYMLWYLKSTEWSQANYLISLFKLCSSVLLNGIKEYSIALLTNKGKSIEGEIKFDPSCLPVPDEIRLRKIPKCPSAPLMRCKSILKARKISSAKERITFQNESPYLFEHLVNSSTRPSSQHSKASSKAKFVLRQNSSARCTPILSCCWDVDTPCSFVSKTFCEYQVNQHIGVNFLRILPVQLSKKIFGYLDEATLTTLSSVNNHWKELAEQVKAELILIQVAKEDVMVMQAASAKAPHPCYARCVAVHIPVIDKEGKLKVNLEGKHIDVVIDQDEFCDLDMEECYNGYETQRVMMEERNVYCNSYNVLVLDARKDNHRYVHYGCGRFVGVGSVDRKISLLDVNTAEHVRSIAGHTGSIKCLCLYEPSNIVVSGSYDTSVRVWDLTTGKCKFIFRGHKGTVLCVAVCKTCAVSSSTDKRVKVWTLATGKCKTTLQHSAVVRTLEIDEVSVITGCDAGVINVWDIETSLITKTLEAHSNLVTCLKLTQYHILSGSLDCFAILWSNIGDLTKPLKTYRHPQEVLCLDISYCRLITSCADGKIRVWNMLNGDCLRVIRGNSKNDAITSLFCSKDRFVVSTLNCILVYNFEPVEWNYDAPRERLETNSSNILKLSRNKPSHAYTRAMRFLYHGSPIHERYNNAILQANKIKSLQNCSQSGRSSEFESSRKTINRIKSAPALNRNTLVQPTLSSINRHIERVKSAHYVMRTEVKNKLNVGEQTKSVSSSQLHNLPWNDGMNNHCDVVPTIPCDGVLKSQVNKTNLDSIKLKESKSIQIKTRCRSAPAYRMKPLLSSERGFTTSSFKYNELPSNKMVARKQRRPQTTARLSNASHVLNDFADLKIKTFYLQLEYEEELRQRKF